MKEEYAEIYVDGVEYAIITINGCAFRRQKASKELYDKFVNGANIEYKYKRGKRQQKKIVERSGAYYFRNV